MLRQMKQSEETLRTSEAQYRTTLDAMGDAIHVVDRDLRIVLLNDAFRAWNEELGLDPDVVGQIICETYAFLSPAIREEYERVFDTAEVLVTEESVQIGERTLVTETRKIPVVKSDNVIQIITVIRDISARKQADEQVRASLREKEVLLREVHHRVKNNLQIVSSLLDLQAESVRDPEALQVLHDSQNRVRSMALVHESLYHSQDLARVDVASYAQALVGYLVGTYASLADDITVNVEADDLALTLDAAIPCGLIVNELVSNALKHAFSPHREGRITVEIRGHANGQVMLAIRDNGVGLPPDWELSSARSLGLQLVDMLTQQLGGTIEIDANDGASFIIRFGGESDQETQQASRDEMGMEAGP
jgi:PAS domain S-box-containing protein